MDSGNPQKVMNAWQAMGFVWDVLFSIAIPTILFALGGRWLDGRLHTAPLFLIIGLILSLAVAAVLILRKAKQLQAQMRQPPREN